MNLKHLLLTIYIYLSIQGANALGRELIFEKLTVKNGLSHNRVQTIFKDSEDFIWFGTLEGLTKYDGAKMTIYRHDPNNLNSISDYLISCLYEDEDSTIWIGTGNGGISKYDRKSGIFSNFLANEYTRRTGSNDVRSFCPDKDGAIWIGMYGGGICRFDKKTTTFEYLKNDPNDKNSLADDNVLSILADGDKIWVAMDGGGLDVYDKTSKTFAHYISSKKIGSLSHNSVYYLFKDSKEQIWIGTDSGLNLFNRTAQSFTSYFHQQNKSNSICDDRVKSIAEDKYGRLWIATSRGLSCLTNPGTRDEFFTNYLHDNSEANSISTNVLTSLYIDNTNILWIGTFDGGVNQANLDDKQFIHYKHNEKNAKSLSQNIIRAIYEDRDLNLWIGTDGGGLNLMRAGTNTFEHYNPATNTSPQTIHNQILAIQQDQFGDMWFGTWGGGLNRLKYSDIKSPKDRFQPCANKSSDSKSLLGDIVQDIFEDKSGRLWIGTENGLSLYKRSSNQFLVKNGQKDQPSQICDLRIQSNTIFQDSDGTIWVGTWNGLNKMVENDSEYEKIIEGIKLDPYSIGFKHYINSPENPKSISDNRIVSIFEDSNKTLWIGTYGKGLNRYDKKNDSFENITEKDGLANDVVYSILEDNMQQLWMSTNNGLSCYSLKTRKFRNYDENDGLQSNYFFWGAGYRRANGDLVFGGTNGFNVFNPSNIKDNLFISRTYISEFKINNKSVSFGNKSPLKVPIWRTKEIVLDYGNDQLSFEFVILNYIHPEKNRYAYKLDGFNDEWIEITRNRSATYTNLSPGEYILRAKGANNDGIWDEKGVALKIVIRPPYYATWWFRSLILGMLFGVLAIIYYLKITSIRKQRNNLKNMVEERTKELHEANSVFFNLNKELSEVNTLLEETNEEITEQAELVISQRDEIIQKNEELELHRNHLEILVEQRTEELVAAKDKAEESERLKAAFLANMSHEIRTPLNAIVGFSNLLTLEGNSKEEIQEFNAQISESTESLLVLIDDILDLSMIEAKQSKRNDKLFGVNEFIQSFFKYWSTHHTIENRKIILNCEDIDQTLEFFSDEQKIKQVIGNLMSNACKFTESGIIELGFKHINQDYIFYVKDTGIGISKKNISVIFDWFRKIEDDNSKLYRGTGLGLAISIRLAEFLGGKLWVESELGVGSTFFFSLPETAVRKS